MLDRHRRRKPKSSRGTARAIGLAVVLHVAAAAGILFYTGHLRNFISLELFSSEPSKGRQHQRTGSDWSGKRSPGLKEQTTYFWTDENGIRNYSNLPPPPHVANLKVRKEYVEDRSPSETRVSIRGNQILVPVKLGYRGNEISTFLLLDTGATTTLIHREAASALQMRPVQHGTSRVADGRVIRTDIAALDYIEVGPHRMTDFTTVIVDHQGAPETSKGLLGMNFLRNVIYHVDFRREVISWENFE